MYFLIVYFVLPGAISCIIQNRKYPGKLSYLPLQEDESTDRSTNDPIKTQQSSEPTLSSDQDLLKQSSQDEVDGSKDNAPGAKTTVDTAGDAAPITEPVDGSKDNAPGAKTTVDTAGDGAPITEPVDGSKDNAPDAKTTVDTAGDAAPIAESACQASVESPSTQFAESVTTSLADIIMTKCSNGPKADLLPSFSTPVPSNWITLQDDFVTAAVMIVAHMGRAMFGDPNLSLGENSFSIVLLNGTMTRRDMVTMFTESSSAGHLALESCSVISAKAIRLEPLTPEGRISIDGEVIPYGPIQCQLHPRLARVMCRKRKEQALVQ